MFRAHIKSLLSYAHIYTVFVHMTILIISHNYYIKSKSINIYKCVGLKKIIFHLENDQKISNLGIFCVDFLCSGHVLYSVYPKNYSWLWKMKKKMETDRDAPFVAFKLVKQVNYQSHEISKLVIKFTNR